MNLSNRELLALLRLVRFMIRTSKMNDVIMQLPVGQRDDLFCDEIYVDEVVYKLEEDTE